MRRKQRYRPLPRATFAIRATYTLRTTLLVCVKRARERFLTLRRGQASAHSPSPFRRGMQTKKQTQALACFNICPHLSGMVPAFQLSFSSPFVKFACTGVRGVFAHGPKTGSMTCYFSCRASGGLSANRRKRQGKKKKEKKNRFER